MSQMLANAQSYLGQSVGTNQYDQAQCVGLFNKVVQNVTGVLYPIKDAVTAYQILGARNTRPDLCQQVINNPVDLSQLPSVGDWIIWNDKLGGGAGHIACVESVSSSKLVTIDQNWTPGVTTRVSHSWVNVAGWVHFKMNEPVAPPQPPADPCADVKAENVALKAQNKALTDDLASARATIGTLTEDNQELQNQVTALTQVVENQKKQIEELQGKLVAAGEDTLMLNVFGKALQWFLVRVGVTK